jgi:hypothetical protein
MYNIATISHFGTENTQFRARVAQKAVPANL